MTLRYLFAFAAVSIALAACSPGDRGWYRVDDYAPLPSGPGVGEIRVAHTVIGEDMPEGLNKTAATELVTGLFRKDLSNDGQVVVAEYPAGQASSPTLYSTLTRVAVKQVNGSGRLLEAAVAVKLTRDGKTLLEKTYTRTWTEADAPDYQTAWREALPPAMLEIRNDIIAAVSR
ncbi:MAG TPA: hypothetical protein DCZ92_00685 [Elusimicrobia bacterium]|nr:MAG: hypothetical protein A2016_09990 [Elusimicrobia bacterium GWF2_62_30]HBA59342.1 hypothetical protein [Elusimicrobiota bacterium]